MHFSTIIWITVALCAACAWLHSRSTERFSLLWYRCTICTRTSFIVQSQCTAHVHCIALRTLIIISFGYPYIFIAQKINCNCALWLLVFLVVGFFVCIVTNKNNCWKYSAQIMLTACMNHTKHSRTKNIDQKYQLTDVKC